MNKGNGSDYKISKKLITLQWIGAVLFGIGYVDLLGNRYIPEMLRFQNYEWVLISLGLLCQIPELFYILKSNKK